MGVNMSPTTIRYEYTWAFGKGPVGISVHDDRSPVSITQVEITTFPGTSEMPVVRAIGQIMRKDGQPDRRYPPTSLAYTDDDDLLEGHARWYLTSEGRTFL